MAQLSNLLMLSGQPVVTVYNTLVRAATGYLAISVAGSANVTLTNSQAANWILELTGALTGNIDVIVPQKEKPYIIYNNTSGAFTLRVKATTGTGPTLAQGTHSTIYCNQVDVVQIGASISGSGAPLDATYLTLSTNGTLTGERVLTAGANVLLTDAGAGSTLTLATSTQNVAWAGVISPTQITADTDDYNPTGLATASTLRLSTDVSRTLTGLAGGANGRLMVVHNIGPGNQVLAHNNASSTAANRFFLGSTATNLTLSDLDSCLFRYDSTALRWRLLASTARGDIAVLTNSTAPGALADKVTMWAQDTDGVAGKSGLHVMTEDGTAHAFGNNIGFGVISGLEARIHARGLDGAQFDTLLESFLTGSSGPSLIFRKARGTTASPTVVANSDAAGSQQSYVWARNAANTAQEWVRITRIRNVVDSLDAQNRVGGRIEFYASPGVSAADALIAQFTKDGNFLLGATSVGTSAAKVFALENGTAPSTNPANVVQVYAADQAAANASLVIQAESGGLTSIGNRVLVGSATTLSNSVGAGGIQLEGAGSSSALLQMSGAGSVAHGMTSLVATSTFLDVRPIAGSTGGVQMRGYTEGDLATVLSSIVVSDPATTKSTSADGALRFEFGKKSGTTAGAMGAGVNLAVFQDSFAANGTRWIVDNAGNTWQPGLMQAKHIGSIVGIPTVAITAAGAGANATVSVTGSDIAGTILLNTSAADTPLANSIILTLTFTSAYATIPRVIFIPAGNTTFDLAYGTVRLLTTETTTTAFILRSAPTLALPATTAAAYRWNYMVID